MLHQQKTLDPERIERFSFCFFRFFEKTRREGHGAVKHLFFFCDLCYNDYVCKFFPKEQRDV